MAWNLIKTASSFLAGLLAVVIVFANTAHADYDTARKNFGGLAANEQATVVIGLSATGDFNGLFAYGYTKRLYRAILAFQGREGFAQTGTLTAAQLKRLDQYANQFFQTTGAQFIRHPVVTAELLVPTSLFNRQTVTSRGLAYEREDKNLSLSFVAYPNSDKSFIDLYASLASDSGKRKVDYKTIRDTYFVASGTYRGRKFYTWMSKIPGGSTGFTLSWTTAWEDVGSRLAILQANSFLPTGSTPEPSIAGSPDDGYVGAERTPPSPAPQAQVSSGTGFLVSSDGHILTNHHVAGNCQEIRVHVPNDIPRPAGLVAADPNNDLALLKMERPVGHSVASFGSAASLRAGSDIVIYGFPLANILSKTGNIVIGNITATAGVGNDSRFYQISAPVQPGNSGGPVLDRQGHVVGVVTARLNPQVDSPQNVNFAIKGNLVLNFLDGVGLNYQIGSNSALLDTPAIAVLAQRFTFLIECRN